MRRWVFASIAFVLVRENILTCESLRSTNTYSGLAYTPMLYGRGMPPEVRKARRNRSLLQTEGNGWDCGAAVRFLAGDEARWITGVALTVDAGATASLDGPGGSMFSTLSQ